MEELTYQIPTGVNTGLIPYIVACIIAQSPEIRANWIAGQDSPTWVVDVKMLVLSSSLQVIPIDPDR